MVNGAGRGLFFSLCRCLGAATSIGPPHNGGSDEMDSEATGTWAACQHGFSMTSLMIDSERQSFRLQLHTPELDAEKENPQTHSFVILSGGTRLALQAYTPCHFPRHTHTRQNWIIFEEIHQELSPVNVQITVDGTQINLRSTLRIMEVLPNGIVTRIDIK